MTLNDIADIFSLFEKGFLIGVLFSGLAFMLGWFINFLLMLVKRA